MKKNMFTIPIKVKKVSRNMRSKRAIREIRRFAQKQTDKEVKIDSSINDIIWGRGAQKPPSSVKVRMVEREEYVTVQSPEKEAPTDKFVCDECGKSFSTEKGLNMHMKRSHAEEEEEKEVYRCEKCDKEFDTKRGLSIHQSQVHGGEEEEEETEDVDYEELLSGTISEGKKKMEKMDNPDYEKLLEAEKAGKDRKGMKSFLEGKMEE